MHAHYAVHELLLEKLEMNVLCATYNNSLVVSERRVSSDAPKIFGLLNYSIEMRGIVRPAPFFLFCRRTCAAKLRSEPNEKYYGSDAEKCKTWMGLFILYSTCMNWKCKRRGQHEGLDSPLWPLLLALLIFSQDCRELFSLQ